jgi:glycosyltransferase involved in cell wall biosynthesis
MPNEKRPGRKRIAFLVATGFSHAANGYVSRVKIMADTLKNMGYKPLIVWLVPIKQLFSGKGFGRRNFKGYAAIFIPRFLNHGESLPRSLHERFIRTCLSVLSRIRKPMFVQAENPTAMLDCRSLTPPLVLDVHGDTVAERNPTVMEESRLRACPEFASERQAVQMATRLICNSQRTLELMCSRHSLDASQGIVVACTTELERFRNFKESREQSRCKLGLQDRIVCCYLGGLAPWQAIGETLDLVARMRQREPRMALLMITPDDPGKYDEPISRIGRDSIRILNLARNQVPDYLPAADIGFVLRANTPTNRVASPTKCGEYLASGVPVVTTPFAGDIPDVFTRFQVGHLLPELTPSESALDQLMTFAKQVENTRAAWCRRAREAAFGTFSWQPNRDRLQTLYHYIEKSVEGDAHS